MTAQLNPSRSRIACSFFSLFWIKAEGSGVAHLLLSRSDLFEGPGWLIVQFSMTESKSGKSSDRYSSATSKEGREETPRSRVSLFTTRPFKEEERGDVGTRDIIAFCSQEGSINFTAAPVVLSLALPFAPLPESVQLLPI